MTKEGKGDNTWGREEERGKEGKEGTDEERKKGEDKGK